jgi:Protein of unknown function (DUF2946)
MKRVAPKRWFVWLALIVLLTQTGLPTLRLATASAGELRAEAILATALCSKPTVTFADGINALLNPWQQHSSKGKHQHCDFCLQNVDAAIDVAGGVYTPIYYPDVNLSTEAAFGTWFTSVLTLVPPPRAPPTIS